MSALPEHPESADVARLRRWEDSGAVWRVDSWRGDSVTILLCTCDGGEEMDRFTSGDPALLSLVAHRLRTGDAEAR